VGGGEGGEDVVDETITEITTTILIITITMEVEVEAGMEVEEEEAGMATTTTISSSSSSSSEGEVATITKCRINLTTTMAETITSSQTTTIEVEVIEIISTIKALFRTKTKTISIKTKTKTKTKGEIFKVEVARSKTTATTISSTSSNINSKTTLTIKEEKVVEGGMAIEITIMVVVAMVVGREIEMITMVVTMVTITSKTISSISRSSNPINNSSSKCMLLEEIARSICSSNKTEEFLRIRHGNHMRALFNSNSKAKCFPRRISKGYLISNSNCSHMPSLKLTCSIIILSKAVLLVSGVEIITTNNRVNRTILQVGGELGIMEEGTSIRWAEEV
jgi:hypothetical protein